MIAVERSLTGMGLLVGAGVPTAVYAVGYAVKRWARQRTEGKGRVWRGSYAEYVASMGHGIEDPEAWSSWDLTDEPVTPPERLWMQPPVHEAPRTTLRSQREP